MKRFDFNKFKEKAEKIAEDTIKNEKCAGGHTRTELNMIDSDLPIKDLSKILIDSSCMLCGCISEDTENCFNTDIKNMAEKNVKSLSDLVDDE